MTPNTWLYLWLIICIPLVGIMLQLARIANALERKERK